MAEIANRPNPLNQYSVKTTKEVTASTSVTGGTVTGTVISGSSLKVDATTINGGNFTGVGTITGSACKIMGTSGSINFQDCFSASSGSTQTAVWLKVNVTGSNYVVQLYAAP